MFDRRAAVDNAFYWARRLATEDTEVVLDDIASSIVDSPDSLWELAAGSAQLAANVMWIEAFVNGERPDTIAATWILRAQGIAYDEESKQHDPDITRCVQIIAALLNHDNVMAKDLIVAHAGARRARGLLGIAQTGLALATTIMQRQPWMMET